MKIIQKTDRVKRPVANCASPQNADRAVTIKPKNEAKQRGMANNCACPNAIDSTVTVTTK